MELSVYNLDKKEVGKVDVSDKFFNVPFKNNFIHQIYTSLLSSARKSIAHAKDRSEVSGGGKKPWRQKGTGRARHGSNRSPIWTGGGVTFGPRNDRNFFRKVNKKAKAKALQMVLSQKIKDNELFVIDSLAFQKTKDSENVLANFDTLKRRNKVFYLVFDKSNKENVLGLKNLAYAYYTTIDSINLISLLKYKNVLINKDAILALENRFNNK